MGAYGLRRSRKSSCRLHLSGVRSARVRGGAAALSFGAADFTAPIVVRTPYWRRHLRGQTPANRRRRCSRMCGWVEDRDPSTPYDARACSSVRSRTTIPVIFLDPSASTTDRSPSSRPARSAPWSKHPALRAEALHRCARQGEHRARPATSSPCCLRHDGTRVARGGSRRRHRRGSDRPRTILPSTSTPSSSRSRDRALRLVHEATRTSGFGAELSALVPGCMLLPP